MPLLLELLELWGVVEPLLLELLVLLATEERLPLELLELWETVELLELLLVEAEIDDEVPPLLALVLDDPEAVLEVELELELVLPPLVLEPPSTETHRPLSQVCPPEQSAVELQRT